MSKEIALLCTLHPASHDKQERVLSLLRSGARSYYTKPSSLCTTWSYFLPYPSPSSSPSSRPIIGGLEIYTDKSALQAQVDDKEFFQAFHETVKKDELYAKDEELVAWYRAAGFIAREGKGAGPFGGVLISLTRIEGDREKILEVLNDFVHFVRDQEPDVLTHAIFTRPKQPKEVLIFVRYKDTKAMKGHSQAPEHVAVAKTLSKLVTNDMSTSTTIWKEIDDSFVSSQSGGPSSTAKL